MTASSRKPASDCGDANRILQATQLVHESGGQRLPAGEDTALPNGVHLRGGHLASRRNPLEEHAVDLGSALRCSRSRFCSSSGRVELSQFGWPAEGHDFRRHPDLLEQLSRC